MLNAVLVPASTADRGIDTDQVLSAGDCLALRRANYSFVIRYIRREPLNAHDLGVVEATRILKMGLGLLVVQHVEKDAAPWWVPSHAKGLAQGTVAASEMTIIGFPKGSLCWLDLEGVAGSVPTADVIDFAQSWYSIVKAAGFFPGLYVGNRVGMTPAELYHRLSFQRYWRAGSLNDDEVPVVRGCCLRQHWPGSTVIPGLSVNFDLNTVHVDGKGDVPLLCVPAASDWIGTAR